MRMIIAGSREFTDYEFVKERMSTVTPRLPLTEVVSGGARGVDRLGEKWAYAYGIPVTFFIPDWSPNGVFDRTAGFKRNREMAEYADMLVAFWDGESRGTKHMIDTAKELGLTVIIMYTN